MDELVTRVVQTAGFNYWESGMDLRLGEDMFDCFVQYQGRLLTVFDDDGRGIRFPGRRHRGDDSDRLRRDQVTGRSRSWFRHEA